MNLEHQLETLELALLEKTGKRLSLIELALIKGACQGQTYQDIATSANYSMGYLKQDVGPKLWQLLCELTGQNVSKTNVRLALEQWTLNRQEKLQFLNTERDEVTQALPTLIEKPQTIPSKVENTSRFIDWGEAIDVSFFCGRDAELETLKEWIVQDNCRLLAILAMGGMGKTALSVKMAQQVQDKFEFVIWRSLRNAPPLCELLADLIPLLSQQQEIELPTNPGAQISRLIYYLQQHRCLLVLDNVESILLSGQPGKYLAGYEPYGELLRRIAESPHQSCVVLTSREKPAEVAALEGASLPVRTLLLTGLAIAAGMQIFAAKGLSLKETEAQQLIACYRGNVLALKIIATSIQELSDGNVSQFLEQGTIVFNGIRRLLDQQFVRLSLVEQQIMYWLAINREWVTLNQLQADIVPTISKAKLLEALEYLGRRALIEQKNGRFTQQPVVMEYMIDLYLETLSTEIQQQTVNLFLKYSLLKAQAKDYVRESQIRVIVEPLLDILQTQLGGQKILVKTILKILQLIRTDAFMQSSYAAGNCLNLLKHLKADLTGIDLSNLNIRQADLRKFPLHQVNLTGSNLSTSVFSEPLSEILKVALSHDEQLVAKSGTDGIICIWQAATGQRLLTLSAHHSHTLDLAFSWDNKTLISVSLDQCIKFWDLKTGACLQTWKTASGVYGFALSPDGKILASGDADGIISVWDSATGKLLKTITGHTAQVKEIVFHPQGKLLASSSFDGTIKLWNIATGECEQKFLGHTSIVWTIAFNSSGTQLVSASFDKSAKVWDVATGQCLHTLQGHTNNVNSVVFSADGELIASCSHDSTIRLWKKTGTQDTWQCIKVLQGHQDAIWSISLGTINQTLISGSQDCVVKFWDISTGQCMKTLQGNSIMFRSLAFHPQNNILISSEHALIRQWNLENGECLQTISDHTMPIWQVVFHPDGKLLARASLDGQVKLWNVSNSDCASNQSIDTLSVTLRQTLPKIPQSVYSVAFSPKEPLLAFGSGDASIRLWNYQTGEIIQTMFLAEMVIVFCIAYQPQGQLLASASSDCAIRLWDVKTGKCISTLEGHTSLNWTVAFHPQGQFIVSGGNDHTLRLWDVQTGECCQVLTGHTSPVLSAAFSPDGKYVASGSGDRTVRIWEIATGTCVRTLEGHSNLVTCVTYHPDPARLLLASCSYDETIRLWDTQTGNCLKLLHPQRLYEGMNITGAIGITEAQKATLKALGAITA